MEANKKTEIDVEKEKREANTCIGLGLGVGALGASGALLSGALCPICVVVAPGIVAAGVIKRARLRKS